MKFIHPDEALSRRFNSPAQEKDTDDAEHSAPHVIQSVKCTPRAKPLAVDFNKPANSLPGFRE